MKIHRFNHVCTNQCFDIKAITVDTSLHVRMQGINPTHRNRLAKLLAVDSRIRIPLIVMKVEDQYLLIDGFHRLAAVEQYNKARKTRQLITEAPVTLYEGSYAEARALAAITMCTGDLKLPEGNLIEAAWYALRDPHSDILRNMDKTSGRNAAAQLGISEGLVRKMINTIRDHYGEGDLERGVAHIDETTPHLRWAIARNPTKKRNRVSGTEKAQRAGIRDAETRVADLLSDTKHEHHHIRELAVQQATAEARRTLALLEDEAEGYWDLYS